MPHVGDRSAENQNFVCQSIRVEVFAKVVRCNVSGCLPENRMACSGVELMVIGNGQRLFLPRLVDASHFDMAAALRDNEKAKLLKNGNNL